MSKTKKLTVNIPDELLRKLQSRADENGSDLETFVLGLLEKGCIGSFNIEEAMSHIEDLIWRNLYWSSLPYTEGLPKQRLNDESVAHYWDMSGAF